MPEAQPTSTAQGRHGETVVLLAALLVVAPISSALIVWGILPALMGWPFPIISL